MRLPIIAFAATAACLASGASAQVELKSYADAEGFINVQALSCAQLAGTFQEDADLLTTWYSGWYNGLAKKHYINVARSKEAEHETIVYCKAHPDVKIIKAIGSVFGEMRSKRGVVISK
ncbi:HdeA/HdeB family protein [Rhizobiales bacterium GAS188]|nr:HdeA/HdeB family protein [Rhizobiales bacterium GAS188]